MVTPQENVTLPLPRGFATISALIAKGVTIPNPWSLDIDDDVDPAKISARGVVLHSGTRLRGATTVISAGCEIGSEGPMAIENCQLGPNVALKGGYATQAVFLDGTSMGLGAHVRGGSILEEKSSGAHNVGLKQTILFPYATLGSAINFCDALLAGGSGSKDHSEVGSSYIHFNFTPDGDKATASMFGDVPRGVLADQSPIFLGGQGGAVGPVSTGFGVVVGAGSILRDDLGDEELIIPEVLGGIRRPNQRARYSRVDATLRKNITYIGSLIALDVWYREVRALFFAQQEFGDFVLSGARSQLASGLKERRSRVDALVEKVAPSDPGREQLCAVGAGLLEGVTGISEPAPTDVIAHLAERAGAGETYLAAIQGLNREQKAAVTAWLSEIIAKTQALVSSRVPAMGLFS